MNEDRMPTLFEILNRFSKPPVDLWSFYVFLREQYGGVEYLEFWLDCAAHTSLCKEMGKEMLKYRQSIKSEQQSNQHESKPKEGLQAPFNQHRVIKSTSSSEIFDVLRDDVLDTSSEHNNTWDGLQEEREDGLNFEEAIGGKASKRMSTLSVERARNKRHTVSRLSEILDNMQFPEYPKATATSPTRGSPTRASTSHYRGHRRLPSDLYEDIEKPGNKYFASSEAEELKSDNSIPSTPPPRIPGGAGSYMHESSQQNLKSGSVQDKAPSNLSPAGITKRAVRDSAMRIINTYLTPKAPKEIELPIDERGCSMGDELRQLSSIPGGLDNPKIFENSTTYVFEALEREALPAFILYRALSNVQPVSSTIRLICGLIALFGGFWLSFVFILLDWQPKWHRCWVILPFAVGWYLTISALYHIDPVLGLLGCGEMDGGGFTKVQEKFVRKMLLKRSLFVLTAIVLFTAAVSVLFIFVPGHRL